LPGFSFLSAVRRRKGGRAGGRNSRRDKREGAPNPLTAVPLSDLRRISGTGLSVFRIPFLGKIPGGIFRIFSGEFLRKILGKFPEKFRNKKRKKFRNKKRKMILEKPP
jgi:hypothetical protein